MLKFLQIWKVHMQCIMNELCIHCQYLHLPTINVVKQTLKNTLAKFSLLPSPMLKKQALLILLLC